MGRYTTLFLFVVLFSENCFGLKCYFCNSEDDRGNSACANVTTQRVTDCKSVPELFVDPKSVSEYDLSCMTIRVGEEKGFPQKVVRTCINYNVSMLQSSGCIDREVRIFASDERFKNYRFTLDDIRQAKGCYCKSDGCNDDSSNHSNTSYLSNSSLVHVLLLLIFIANL